MQQTRASTTQLANTHPPRLPQNCARSHPAPREDDCPMSAPAAAMEPIRFRSGCRKAGDKAHTAVAADVIMFSGQGLLHTLVHFSAQLEPCLTHKHTNTP